MGSPNGGDAAAHAQYLRLLATFLPFCATAIKIISQRKEKENGEQDTKKKEGKRDSGTGHRNALKTVQCMH